MTHLKDTNHIGATMTVHLPTTHPSLSHKTGVLCVNLGTPDAPTYRGIRRFLKQFLSDRRVIDTPRWLWWPILYGFILSFRPLKIAKQYQAIWTDQGSPLSVHTLDLAKALQEQLDQAQADTFHVIMAMRYGQPSIEEAIKTFEKHLIRKIIVLPLFPQYSATTTASVFDAVAKVLKHRHFIPEMHWIQQYSNHPQYINALAHSVKQSWAKHGKTEHLMITFHGIPQRYFNNGDPYYCFCHKTARLLREKLGLTDNQATMVFQSRFGPSKWLEPACDDSIKALAKQGIQSLTVISPGFAADCLETLEEINETYRTLFLEHGGKTFHYVPALNASEPHAKALASLILGSP